MSSRPAFVTGFAKGIRTLLLVVLTVGLRPHGPAVAQERPWVERVDVTRLLIDVRVLDDEGRLISDLEPSDFMVKIDGKPARVESAQRIGMPPADKTSGPAETSLAVRSSGDAGSNAPQLGLGGRLVVILVQKDLEPRRIVGLMEVSRLVDALLQPLTADDRVAVLSFDYRLHVWTDFTNDLDRVRSMLAGDVIRKHPGPVTASRDVSLVSRLDEKSVARISGIEHAMRRIAESLTPLPGAKSLVLLGYGFGRFNARTGDVMLMDGYEEASAALQRARVAVFTLNVTQAHYNSLQAGLQTISHETGGTYASLYEFPSLAIRRVSHALAGHYVLFVEKPALERGVHRVEVRLARRRGSVIARASYADDR